MKILVTNDDGIESPGIWALAEAMKRVGDVLVVAPDRQQSGVGTAISYQHGLSITEAMSSIPEVHAYAVDGTPTDCVILGLDQLADEGIDLIVSGINTELVELPHYTYTFPCLLHCHSDLSQLY